jgi:hypothetical protein
LEKGHVVASLELEGWAVGLGVIEACSRAGGAIADKAKWGFFGFTNRSYFNTTFIIDNCQDSAQIYSPEHLFSEMMVSRGPRPTLAQGLDREVSTNRLLSGRYWV